MSKSDSERGQTLVTVAVTLVVLLAFLALAIDIGFGYVERRRVQAVTDAAALAGATVLTDNGSDTEILAVVREYVLVQNPLAANESSRDYTTQWLNGTTVVGTVGIGPRPAGATGILVTVKGHMPTFFARIWNISQVTAAAQGGGGYSPLDVMLVLDRSGSMDDDSCFLKSTTSGFSLRTHFKTSGQCQEVSTGDGLSSSNCGNCKGTWKTSPNRCTWPGGTTMGSEVNTICGSVQTNQALCTACKGVWKTPPQPITDLQTASSSFVDLVEAQLAATSPHMGLVSYSDTANLDVTLGDPSSVKSYLPNVAALGYTNCEDGVYKAEAELTTSGRQRWTAVKVIVFMSDGNANRCRNYSGDCSTANPTAKQRAINEAQLAGTKGITVYTIGLGAAADQDMLRQMVTTGGAYVYAPTGADLSTAFATMFQKIKRMRLVQ
jgi:hypothetical protein